MPKVESSPAFGSNGLIILTWDEGADPPQDPGDVLAVVIGSRVRPGTYGGGPIDHYSMARTLADGFGVKRLANAKRARPLPAIWK